MLMPRARPSCLSPHLLGSALEEVGGLHGHTGLWALCCDSWDVNTDSHCGVGFPGALLLPEDSQSQAPAYLPTTCPVG